MNSKISALPGCVLLLTLSALGGCSPSFVPADQLTAAQNHARDLYTRHQETLAAQQAAEQMLGAAEQEKQFLGQHLADVESQLATANARIDNLMAERSELKQRYSDSLLGDGGTFTSAGAPLDGFEYDPVTGLNRFQSDVLFELGSDVIRPQYEPTIRDFASAVTNGVASGMRVLVVGHTDDQRIARPETAARHPTNWHLSTDRSAAVILSLIEAGVEPERIASMGYSEFHPLELERTDTARQRNRRVELYVVPDDPSLTRWSPELSRQ